MKNYLFIISRAPYASSHAFEQLEAAMVAAVFDASVTVLLRDEGVWALQPGQEGSATQQNTFAKALAALPAYEVEQLYVCEASLRKHGVGVDPSLGFKPMRLVAQQQLIDSSDVVIGGQS